jgi:pSer/pThr/pTyr-binding forkhead associated (FHA) protein
VSELTLTVIRLGFLAVLWLFVLTTVSVMRTDLFGTRVSPRAKAGRSAAGSAATRTAKPAKPRRGTPSALVVTQGALAGTSVRLGETAVTIGRSHECTLVLGDDYTSSKHARLFADDGRWYVEDLGSTNGTYLDRTKVTSAAPVPIGVPIRIGKTVLELRK